MYDNFEPLNELKMFPFDYKFSKYELWEKGNIIKQGQNNGEIIAKVINYTKEQMNIEIDNNKIPNFIKSEMIFDKLITSVDRLQLLIIPENPPSNNRGIMIFKSFFGSTRANKSFNENEPYCCNIFFINKKIDNITFSFSNPERLLKYSK